MPPVMATRDLRSLSPPPQVVHFIPMQATPNPAMDTMMPTIIKARVACSEPEEDRVTETTSNEYVEEDHRKCVLAPLRGPVNTSFCLEECGHCIDTQRPHEVKESVPFAQCKSGGTN